MGIYIEYNKRVFMYTKRVLIYDHADKRYLDGKTGEVNWGDFSGGKGVSA